MTRWLLAAILCASAAAAAGAEERPAAVTPRHWSYQAIADMAGRGLVHGYRDSKFLDGRTLTRFEMASLVKRVLDSLLEVPLPETGRVPLPETPGSAAARGQGVEPPPTGRPLRSGIPARTAAFTEADLGTVRRLTDAYSVELAVIGANLQEAAERMTALEGRVEAIEAAIRDPKGPLQTAIRGLARIDRLRLSGYIQARYQSFENTNEATSGDRPTQVVDTFTVRRVRLTAAARPTERVGARWQVEGAGGSVETRDAWIDYYFTGNPATGHTATFGQMKLPFGFEVVQSSSVRETPERARVARFFYPDERDRGVKIASPTGRKLFYEAGLYNGIQLGSRGGINTNDNNNDKNVVGRVRATLLDGRLDLGASLELGSTLRTAAFPGETGIGPGSPRENTKRVFGADLQWFPVEGTLVRAEWMGGKATGTNASGYILTLVQNVGKRNQAVVKYDWFGVDDFAIVQRGPVATPLGSGLYAGTLSTWHIGWVHQLDASTRLKLFYEIHRRGRETVDGSEFQWIGNILRFEVITLF